MIRTAVALLVALLAAATAHAQSWPTRPLRAIVPYPPGGLVDVGTRLLGQSLAVELGQPVIVDNRPGASTAIGANIAVKAPADGYTILMASNTTLAASTRLVKDVQYRADDFLPVALVAKVPMGITAFPAFGPNTVQELVALAKAGPGKVLYSTQGVGTMGHLGGELLGRLAGISMSDVPFKGTSDGMAALLGGQVHLTIDGVALYIPHIRAGRLKGIALFSDRRLPAIPNVPTVIESGYKDALASFWFGAVVPKGTPSAVVERLARAINTVIDRKSTRLNSSH